MNEHATWWAGSFGDAYLQRNRVRWQDRRSFWELMLERTAARSVLEVGANAGWNLLALRDADPTLKLRGVDVNDAAIAEATANGLDVRKLPGAEVGALWPARFGLVFTAGVLIHVAPADLEATMRSIITASNRHVLAVEYASAVEEPVEYRGHEGKLWRRPFGRLYEDLGLMLEDEGDVGPGDGFGEGCTYWLLSKAPT